MQSSAPRDVDVVLVGAGLAGLSAARALADAGARVLVLEARDRVGGRTLGQRIGGATLDLGGQWLGANQPRLAALARELGVETFPTYSTGRKLLYLDGRVSSYPGTIPDLPVPSLLALHLAQRRLDALSARMPLDPLAAPDAAALDAVSVEHLVRRILPVRDVREVFDAAFRVVFGAEPAELSVLYFLSYLRAGGGFMKLVEIEGGAQERRFVGSAQALSLGLAARLGERVILNAPVRRVEQTGERVRVQADRLEVRARYVVVCVPPALASRIEFRPLLPPRRDSLFSRFPMGATVKCIAVYDRPFWREAGLSGEAVANTGPLSVVFDNGSHDGAVHSLLGFVVGAAARGWAERPPEERREAVLGTLERMFGAEARTPVDYVEQDWCVEPWTRGCPVGVLGTGALSAFGRSLREPVGRIHWAGTETASEWTGYMEGALESGERAAREVAAALGLGANN
jgi:monoamine oxidase